MMSETLHPLTPATRDVYRQIAKATGAVGGNGSFGPIYGEMTSHSMQRIVNFLKEKCGFTGESVFVDIGAGLGKPSCHVASDPGCAISLGIECEAVRYNLSMVNLRRLTDPADGALAARERPNVLFARDDVFRLHSLNPVTHVFLFDVGMPARVLHHVARIFNASFSPQYLIIFRRPALIEEYGFEVELMDKFSIGMTASKERHMCFIYKRTTPEARRTKCSREYPASFAACIECMASGWDSYRAHVASEVDRWSLEALELPPLGKMGEAGEPLAADAEVSTATSTSTTPPVASVGEGEDKEEGQRASGGGARGATATDVPRLRGVLTRGAGLRRPDAQRPASSTLASGASSRPSAPSSRSRRATTEAATKSSNASGSLSVSRKRKTTEEEEAVEEEAVEEEAVEEEAVGRTQRSAPITAATKTGAMDRHIVRLASSAAASPRRPATEDGATTTMAVSPTTVMMTKRSRTDSSGLDAPAPSASLMHSLRSVKKATASPSGKDFLAPGRSARGLVVGSGVRAR